MKKFMDDSFLLSTETAKILYNEYAKDMPIIDYHCHLSPQEIFENKTFKNITEAWLYGDHYKWRVMRANGIDETYITGDADDYEKFLAWAKTVPLTIGNPLYNWTHLELQRFFGIYDLLNEQSAPAIWEKVNALLAGEGFGARDIIRKFNVEVICTTDDPVDSLEYHRKIKADESFNVQVLPSFRPDKGLNIQNEGFREWVEKLASVSGINIQNFADFLQAVESRIDFFHQNGCRVSDHALDEVVFDQASKEEAEKIFAKALSGEALSVDEETTYKSFVLVFLGEAYAKRGWAMQYHMKALRNTNKRMFAELGPDTGFDSINDGRIAKPLSQLLNALEEKDSLPKTILYSLNPTDNDVVAAMTGNFQGGIPGKIQFGTAWWFNDQKDGMLDQMKTLANLGLFGRFIGMLTDSRSFLSYTRHEYFRRLMCDLVGSWVENGEVPDDMEMLGEIVQGISYNNAKNYFQFDQ